MNTVFLLLIYLAFISLGLPDTLLGSAWPVMQPELGVSLDAQGLITLIVSCATILSCLLNERIVRLLGTAKITALSGIVTAASLLGYALSPSYIWLLLFSIPLGLGAGSVDTCLNNYASLHLSARHVNWLTCFYALGASAGPALLAFILGRGQSWHTGYFAIAMIQFAIAIILVLTLPVWRGRDYRGEPFRRIAEQAQADAAVQNESQQKRPLFRIPGVLMALMCYALFFGIQYGTGLWAPSYLVDARGFSVESAARTASVFYICVMVGRILSGLASEKLSDKALVRIGAGLCIVGTFSMSLPLTQPLYYVALAMTGLGCAPIFPSMIHMTPSRFGRKDSERVMGVQMAAAYVGNVVLCPLIGVVAERAGTRTIPWFLFIMCIAILCLSERVDRTVSRHPPEEQAQPT
ncbi:MAG: MFS transporter [Oscillospiraceae bacterium]|nr:MFS transporter [Oscillospiraceae bacterium]